MFCPSCRCEFRPSFTRCASCDVDLVDDLTAVEENAEQVREPEAVVRISMAEICGYFDLAEARLARDLLHRHRIQAEIVIRSSPETPPDGAVVEEYWLRADAQQVRQAAALVEQDAAPAQDDGTFKCSHCDRPVREEETFCANCGMRFSE